MKRVQRASAAKAQRVRARRHPRDIRGDRACCSAYAAPKRRRLRTARGRPSPSAKVLPDLGTLHFIGRAITPPGRPRRFDARFFTMDASAIAHRIEGVTGPDAELVELVWMPLAEAKQLDMPAVTGVMLEELDARIADGFGHDLPVPFYQHAARHASGGNCCKVEQVSARIP